MKQPTLSRPYWISDADLLSYLDRHLPSMDYHRSRLFRSNTKTISFGDIFDAPSKGQDIVIPEGNEFVRFKVFPPRSPSFYKAFAILPDTGVQPAAKEQKTDFLYTLDVTERGIVVDSAISTLTVLARIVAGFSIQKGSIIVILDSPRAGTYIVQEPTVEANFKALTGS